eukprot:7022318-Prymnesium_polylepis.1
MSRITPYQRSPAGRECGTVAGQAGAEPPIGGSADWAVRAEAEGEGRSTVGACLRDLGECGGLGAIFCCVLLLGL